jgi:hypothetical protein
LAARRSSEGEARAGTRSRRQRLFGLLFWSQKSDNPAANMLMNTSENNYEVNKWLFEKLNAFALH